ncbi:serine/threonine-protein kinase [Ulvibacter sp. MAR_2010_11]|uniref:serine/threonine-protein kinase n=1 Tax=Ulvibacter sp. MAR_2010_11 TaxID=1250229 RepID=UPI000C2C7F69|nr:serine/threonine-protein kinase [Ulvibacter sp. MAR_2010_11]PKA82353.1 serine/threonine-protein kinase [Ulvibacter sp. MAR_2010_11]
MDIGKFTTIGFIGGGNFGKVFRAKDNLLDVERAIKLISVQNPQQFIDAINEAQILEKCRHPNIVDVKEIDIHQIQNNPVPCIAMEYLSKGSAQGFLEKNFVTVKKAIKIVSDVLFGLEHAHNEGIYHRDIKPANILFADNLSAKLSDFGLAYGLANQPFNFAGYNSHLPPEVLEGVVQDALSDIYSLGITFYRLINNLPHLSVPYNNDAEWLDAVKREKFPKREFEQHIPSSILRVVRKSMKPNRNDRYNTCLEFRQALQKIPLAINWTFIADGNWKGKCGNDQYELKRYNKRTGFFIDFFKNGRKDNNHCCSRIPDESTAKKEFFKIIQETTMRI